MDGVQYLVQAYPDADWVKNARVGGRGLLRRGRRTVAMRLVEVPQERRGALLRQFPVQHRRGVGAFVRNGPVDSPTLCFQVGGEGFASTHTPARSAAMAEGRAGLRSRA